MLTRILFTTILAAVASVNADPTPSVPGPGDTYNEGSNCLIQWEADPTGAWKTMNIELMTGGNLAMKHLTTVTTVDGTDATKTTYSYPCPAVTPNSAIYFYQFTSPASNVTLWTTRFTIASKDGNAVPPEHSTQPNGDAIPWGDGALVDPSSGTPPPTSSGSASANSTSASASGSPSGSSASVSLPSVPSSTPSGMSVSASVSVHSSASKSASSSGSVSPSATGAAAANSAAGVTDSLVLRGAVSIAAVAAVFAMAL